MTSTTMQHSLPMEISKEYHSYHCLSDDNHNDMYSDYCVLVGQHLKPQNEGKVMDDLTSVTVTSDSVADDSDYDSDCDEEDHFCTPQKCVSFSTTFTSRRIESHLTYSQEERSSCWYTSDEIDEIVRDVESMTARVNAGEQLDIERGLESRTEKGIDKVESRIMAVWDAVMHEQYGQWDAGFCNDDWIAQVSLNTTADCVREAVDVAKEDERVAANLR